MSKFTWFTGRGPALTHSQLERLRLLSEPAEFDERSLRQQRFDDPAVNAGFTVAVVVDRRADDRAGLLIGQHRADAAGMAEQGVARQLGELFALQ